MSARKFLRRASKQVRHFWQRLSCTSRSNTAVEEIAEDLADNDVDIVSVPVIPAVHQSASFSAARFAPMPLLPGEVPSSRCRSVMGDWNQYRPVHTVNRLVNTTRARHDARGHVRVQDLAVPNEESVQGDHHLNLDVTHVLAPRTWHVRDQGDVRVEGLDDDE